MIENLEWIFQQQKQWNNFIGKKKIIKIKRYKIEMEVEAIKFYYY